MEWKIDYLSQDGIVRVKTRGSATWESNKKMSEESVAIARQNGSHRFLIDHRDLKEGLSTLEVDKLPEMLKGIGVNSEDRAAIVFDPALLATSSFEFFMNTAYLAKMQLDIFNNPREAIRWLKSDMPAKLRK